MVRKVDECKKDHLVHINKYCHQWLGTLLRNNKKRALFHFCNSSKTSFKNRMGYFFSL
jgi:hypothetical protein